MAAIITNDFRRNSVQTLLKDVTETGQYYIGIGKSDPWDDDINEYSEDSSLFQIPVPGNKIIESQDALNNLIALVKVQGTYPIIPRNEWVAGRKYKVYDITDPNLFNLTVEEGDELYPCYVSYRNKIYICLQNNDNAESVDSIPLDYDDFKDEVNNTFIRASTGSDGYIWAYIQTNADNATDEFYTDSFVTAYPELDPITQISDIQNAKDASGGLIYGFKIINGGTGVIPSDRIDLVGRGENNTLKSDILISDGSTSTPFTVTITSGVITDIKITSIINSRPQLLGYLQASVQVDNHPEIQIIPLVAPINGFGNNPISDLPTFYAGITADFEGNVAEEAPTNTSFRQITLVKGPKRNIITYPDSSFLNTVTGELYRYYIDSSTSNIYIWDGANFVLQVGITEADIDNNDLLYGPSGAIDALSYFEFDPLAGGITQEYETGSIIEQTVTGARAFLDAVDMTSKKIFFHQNTSPRINLKKFNPVETQITITETGGSPISSVFTSLIQPEHLIRTGDVLFLENRKKIDRNENQDEQVRLVIQM